MYRSVSSLILLLVLIPQLFFPAALLADDNEKGTCSGQEKKEYDKYLKESYVPKSDEEVKGTKYEGFVQFLDNEPAVFGNVFDLKTAETPRNAGTQFFLTSSSELDKIDMEVCVKEDCIGQSITLCFPSKNANGQRGCGCKFDCYKLSNYLQFKQKEKLKMEIGSCDNPGDLASKEVSISEGKCVKTTWSLSKGSPNGDDVKSQLSVEGIPRKFEDDIKVHEHNGTYFVYFNILVSKEGCFYMKFPGLDLKLSGTPPFSGTVENTTLPSTVATFVGSAGFYTLVIAGPLCLLFISILILVLICMMRKKKQNSSPSDDPANRPDAATCIAVSEEHSNHPPSEEARPVEYTARASTEENTFEIGRKRAAQDASRAKTSRVAAQKKVEDARVKKVNANFNVNETSVDQTASHVGETKPSIYNPTVGASTDATSCQQNP